MKPLFMILNKLTSESLTFEVGVDKMEVKNMRHVGDSKPLKPRLSIFEVKNGG